MGKQWFFECEKCGHVGKVEDLKDHPTRAMPEDLGFCPKCGSEVQDPVDEAHIRKLADEYGEDQDSTVAAAMNGTW